MFDLCDFQYNVFIRLMAFAKSNDKKITLKSPTGSGKTFMLTYFMNEFVKMEDDVVFLWFTPGKGNLEEQSKRKMDLYFPDASTKLLSDVLTEGFASGDCSFLNWEALNKESNNALKDGDRDNLHDKIRKAENDNLKFYVILDESHTNDTTKANTVLSYFKIEKIINASATPKLQKDDIVIRVDEKDVIKAGLIKKYICFNKDVNTKNQISNTEHEYLITQGLQKRREIVEAYSKCGVKINPLLMIQLPNNNKTLQEDVERFLYTDDVNITYENNKLACMLSNDKKNIDYIDSNEDEAEVLIFKQAIATGWDCPRAHILVKLRDQSNETFEIQVIGRIRRMPEVKHYDNEVLDNCYVYTFDKDFTDKVKENIGDEAVLHEYLSLDKDVKNFVLTKEMKSDRFEIQRDYTNISIALYNNIVNDYKITTNIDENRNILESQGWILSKDIIKDFYKGDVDVFSRIMQESFEKAQVDIKIDTHFHGRMYLSALNEIASSMHTSYRQIRKIIDKIFGEARVYSKSKYKKILKLSPKELYAFIINNLDNGKLSLKKIFIKALSADSGDDIMKNLVADRFEEFKIPKTCMFFYKEDKDFDVYINNVYKGYNSQAYKRSEGEKEFEKYLANNKNVEWWYKNGDKGEDFFSILYADNTKYEKLFYPDYIVKKKDEIWIVETKGGEDIKGEDDNIDEYAKKKFDALSIYLKKDYAIKVPNLKGAFIRLKKSNRKLYICVCNTNSWTNDMNGDNWIEISKIL